jgi:hypothetical protein
MGAVKVLRFGWRGALFIEKFLAASSQRSVEITLFLTTVN